MALIRLLGAMIYQACHTSGRGVTLLGQSALQLPFMAAPRRLRNIRDLLFAYSIAALPVTIVVSLFTGMIIALNSGLTLAELGQEGMLGRLVALSMVREMGPVFTGLILAASIGSGVAAEIGTMRVSDEIDALEIMSISPVRYLVVPRVVALTLLCPTMTIFADVIGTAGGALIGHAQFGVGWSAFRHDATTYLELKDLYSGLFKATVFGLTIGIVGCTQGLQAKNGATGVGEATRRAVVSAFLLIIFFTYIITWIVYQE
ncbi:MAG: MlaE family ABC transporter permease [Planctomycetota bacterium]